MKKIFVCFFMIVIQLPLGAQTKSQDDFLKKLDDLLAANNLKKGTMGAQDFNSAGMFFYEKKLWHEAQLMFLRALQLDRKHILANYNLACVLSICYQKGFPDDVASEITMPEDSFYYLTIAVTLDTNRKIRARNDPDFNNIRQSDIDKEYFDKITLENLPAIEKRKLVYVGLDVFQGDFRIYFSTPGQENDRYGWHGFPGWDNIFFLSNLYHIEAEYYQRIQNEQMVGKTFNIEIIHTYQFGDSLGLAGNAGPPQWLLEPRVLTIKESTTSP